MDQQLWLLFNTYKPGHWGPSRWGLQLGAGCAALLLSFGALISAARPVEVIFSFLLLLLSLLLPLLQLEADYVGAIHLMVYPGAILIFFSFATLTTDQQGHWGELPSLGGKDNIVTVGMRHWLATRLPALLVALPLLLLWWRQLAGRVGFSLQNRAGQLTRADLAPEELLSTELLRSSDLVTLGLEIFQRRLLSLTLLGLLLLLAFLTALELLSPQKRRRSSNLFPRLGAGMAASLGLQHPR
jgi:NADH:ubiquinone oxidoreductase subunit 6 (subunit J)